MRQYFKKQEQPGQICSDGNMGTHQTNRAQSLKMVIRVSVLGKCRVTFHLCNRYLWSINDAPITLLGLRVPDVMIRER